MSVGTAKTAGVGYVIACAPPRDSEGMYPYTLYALHAAGADEIYDIGGVQAMCEALRTLGPVAASGGNDIDLLVDGGFTCW